MSGKEPAPPSICVIVAAADATMTAVASVQRFADEVGSRGEVLVVDGSTDGTASLIEARALPRVRVLRRPSGQLVPELWRDGLRASASPLVALSTAQMLPSPGWLDGLLTQLDASDAVGVGGPIEPTAGLSPLDQAVYLLRYVHYHRPVRNLSGLEPPGDNALYRREALDRVEQVWARGFWETEVHRALRVDGAGLAMAQDALVRFHGGSSLARFARQRHRHAWHYGAQRGARMGVIQRVGRIASAPAVPCLLLRRIASALAARGDSLARWTPALPWLGLLLASWSTGEALGMWAGARARPDAA